MRWFAANSHIQNATVLSFLLLTAVAQADVECDGIDDNVLSTTNVTTFMSSSTGTMTLWYKPTGTASTVNQTCTGGEALLADVDPGLVDYGYLGLYRNPDLGGLDRICGFNDDLGGQDIVATTYTANAWTPLAWEHTGGNLNLYKDGVLVSTIASGDTSTGLGANDLHMCAGGVPFIEHGEGRFANVVVYPTALGATEIRQMATSRLYYAGWSVPSGHWTFDQCGEGVNCTGVVFADRSGNGRVMTADDGANNTGMMGRASEYLSWPQGVMD